MAKTTNLYVCLETGLKEHAELLTEADMNQKLEKGYTDFVQEKTKPAAQAFDEIRKDYNL
jgi:hypothetical protein